MEGDGNMLVIPAIDLKDGQVVRLYQGDYEQKKIYSYQPEEVAKEFENLGAKYIHIVDLDGAKIGKNMNLEAIKRIRQNVNIPIELGGGIRDKGTVELYLEKLKIDRVILGTVALNNPEFLKEMLQKYGPEKIVVGVDIKEGKISTSGWLDTSKVYYLDFIQELEQIGVKYIIVTDISKDGTLQGPNYEIYQTIKENSNIQFVVSGGVKDLQDIRKVSRLDYYGCIVGKAYYEGKMDLKKAIEEGEK